MFVFNHPYVGTEHFFLAFLKKHTLKSICFDNFREYVATIIGYGTIPSETVLYTPILREIKNNYRDEKKAIVEILKNEDSIVHNILICKKVDIDEIISEVNSIL